MARVAALLPWSVLALAAAFGLRRLDNTDTWWHLAAGRWIVENRAVPVTDPFSFTAAGHAWINLQWLFDVGLLAIHSIAGPAGLVLLKAALFVGTIALLVPLVRRWLGPVSATGLLVWVVFVCQQRIAVRPEQLSFLLLVLLLSAISPAGRAARFAPWTLPALMLVWVNVHALFAVGLFVIVCALLSDLASRWTGQAPAGRRLWIGAGLAAVATLLNPYGIRGALFPLELPSRFERGSAYAAIGEFQGSFFEWWPTWSLGAFQFYFLAGCAVVCAAAVVAVRRRRVGKEAPIPFDPGELLAFLGLAVLAVLARRNAALFVLGTAPFVSRCLALVSSRLPGPPARAVTAAGFALALGMPVAVWAVSGSHYYRWDAKTHQSGIGILEGRFPQQASRFVADLGLPGPMFNDLSTGGWLAWSRPTPEGVFIDGRLEVYDEWFADYLEMLGNPDSWQVQADRLGIRSAMIYHRYRNRHGLIRALLESPDWEAVYADEVAIVFVVRGAGGTLLDRARAAYRALRPEIENRLLAPSTGWGHPRGKALSLSGYARILVLLGQPDTAARFFERAVAIGLSRGETLSHSVWLAGYHLSAGRRELARDWIERARRIDSGHPAVRSLSESLL